MWKCQIFLRLGGKNAVARVAVQAAVYSLSYCYGAFYTIVLFRQLVNAIQARASFESVLGLLAAVCLMCVLFGIYFAVYLLCTPPECLTPDQWTKIWRVVP